MREVEKTTKCLEKRGRGEEKSWREKQGGKVMEREVGGRKSHGKRSKEEKSWKGKQGGKVMEREAVPCMRVKQINQQICIIERDASIYIPTITLKRRKKSK